MVEEVLGGLEDVEKVLRRLVFLDRAVAQDGIRVHVLVEEASRPPPLGTIAVDREQPRPA